MIEIYLFEKNRESENSILSRGISIRLRFHSKKKEEFHRKQKPTFVFFFTRSLTITIIANLDS